MNLFSGSGFRPLPPAHPDHADLARLEAQLLSAVGGKQLFEEKLRSFFRSTIDEVIDTGRFTLSRAARVRLKSKSTRPASVFRRIVSYPQIRGFTNSARPVA